MTQSGSYMQQLNAGNEGKDTGRVMGVFLGVSNRPIVQNLYFLSNTTPTQGGNVVAIIVATTELQCAASIYAASAQRSAQTIM